MERQAIHTQTVLRGQFQVTVSTMKKAKQTNGQENDLVQVQGNGKL